MPSSPTAPNLTPPRLPRPPTFARARLARPHNLSICNPPAATIDRRPPASNPTFLPATRRQPALPPDKHAAPSLRASAVAICARPPLPASTRACPTLPTLPALVNPSSPASLPSNNQPQPYPPLLTNLAIVDNALCPFAHLLTVPTLPFLTPCLLLIQLACRHCRSGGPADSDPPRPDVTICRAAV